jgi:hypothetical protein
VRTLIIAGVAGALCCAAALAQHGGRDRDGDRESGRDSDRRVHPRGDQSGGSGSYARRPGDPDPYAVRPGDANPYAARPGDANPYVTRPGDANPYATRAGDPNPYATRAGDPAPTFSPSPSRASGGSGRGGSQHGAGTGSSRR